MKHYAALVVLLLATVAVLFSIFGEGGYTRLTVLQKSLEAQKLKNHELEANVSQLSTQVRGILHDSRVLEKAARNELGMARPDELIFIFEKQKDSTQ